MDENMDTLLTKYIKIFFVVSGYWIVSILTVFVNKTLLSEVDLEAPMFIAFFQTFTSVLICLCMKYANILFPQQFYFPESKAFALQTIKIVLPVSIFFTSMIAANNLCLKYVSVAFYYIGRSLTTIFNVVFTYLILGEKTSKKCILCCFVIIYGFYLGVDEEYSTGYFSIFGTIFGVTASLALSLYSIFTKRVLPSLNQEIWLLSYYNNIYSSILFVPIMLANGEFSVVASYSLLWDVRFWMIMIMGSLCGFLIGIFTALQIKYTSALTHNISGTAKACAQTVFATHWYEETKTKMWWFSNALVLFGSAAYARIKQMEMEIKHKTTVSFQKV